MKYGRMALTIARSGIVPVGLHRGAPILPALLRHGTTIAGLYAGAAAAVGDRPAIVDDHGMLTFAEVGPQVGEEEPLHPATSRLLAQHDVWALRPDLVGEKVPTGVDHPLPTPDEIRASPRKGGWRTLIGQAHRSETSGLS